MPSARGAMDAFLSLFKPKPLIIPDNLPKRPELTPGDYQARREMFPIYPLSGWTPARIQDMLEQHDIGNFQASELFYHALRKEGLIASALNMRRAAVQVFSYTLQCPKDAPDEMHVFTEALAKDWQSVMPDDVRGDIIERTNVFGFMVCRLQWTYKEGQRQPRLIPWTHSSLSYRQDLYCYQGLDERGIVYINNDGREFVVFSLGGTRPWLRGLIRPLAFVYFGIITGDDRWLNFNDEFAEPMKLQYTPRLTRETPEAQRLYEKANSLRGGDVHLCPREDKDKGYDFRYEQVDAKGFETLASQLERFDNRAAIIILGHNLLQMVKGGSLAAMKAALKLLAMLAQSDGKILMTALEPMSKVWARANFGESPEDFPELGGELPESKSWSLVYDFTDPEDKQMAGVRAAQFGQGFATFIKSIVGKDGLVTYAPEIAMETIEKIDFIESAERCGIPMKSGEEAYSENDDDDAELSGETYIRAPSHMVGAAKRSLAWMQALSREGLDAGRLIARKIVRGKLTARDIALMARYFAKHAEDRKVKGWNDLKRPTDGRIAWGLFGDYGDGRGQKWAEQQAEKYQRGLTSADLATLDAEFLALGAMGQKRGVSAELCPTEQPLLLASGDSPDSAAGLIEGQRQIDDLADEDTDAPGLAAILAALAAAVDWGDLRERLVGIVREHDLRDAQSVLRERLRVAEHIGTLSVDHDLPASARAEVDAMDRKRTQAEKVTEARQTQERAGFIAKAATAYALYSIARHLWDGAKTTEATGHPLEMYKRPLGEALAASWGKDGALWDTARAQPLQTAFTRARAKRFRSEPLAIIYPYWRFEAVLDGATTPICRRLGNPPLIRPAGSPDFPIPPLHWHCRSTIRGMSRVEAEGRVSQPLSVQVDDGFGEDSGYPQPDGGPEELLRAYRGRQ